MWYSLFSRWNGVSVFYDCNAIPADALTLFTDSSSPVGFGAFYQSKVSGCGLFSCVSNLSTAPGSHLRNVTDFYRHNSIAESTRKPYETGTTCFVVELFNDQTVSLWRSTQLFTVRKWGYTQRCTAAKPDVKRY